MSEINSLSAIEILDSRGKPTIKCYCQLSSGVHGEASVPSGASTGKAEAHELRDMDPTRFDGNGCLTAVSNVNDIIAQSLAGKKFYDQRELDEALIRLDGTSQKSELGANTILSVSLAFARAKASEMNLPLYKYFSYIIDKEIVILPRPTINLFSGGKHAGGQVPIQDLLVVPTQADIMSSLNAVYRVYQSASKLCQAKYGMRALSADEGGLAPPFKAIEDIFNDTMTSIEDAELVAGEDICLAMDVASSHFYNGSQYDLGGQLLDPSEMISELANWTNKYPIVSVEDALAEEDWSNWTQLTGSLGERSLILGDDFLCTNPDRIRKAIDLKAANSLLLKVNQIGTLTEAAEAYRLAKKAGWQVTISARSGETEDNWLSDLAVGWQGDQIKIGSITQSERLSKYNRLLEIEKETGLSVNPWPG